MNREDRCESCSNYIYDEQTAEYCCDLDLDEDEMGAFLTGHTVSCPYYSFDDEYAIVRKQN